LPSEDERKLEFELRGKSWEVYWLLLKNSCPMSVREVQKVLRFSSPSVAQHHLDRLCELKLAKKESVGGTYILVNEVRIGVLRHFIKLGKMLFPRYFFYAVFSTTFYIIYMTLLMRSLSPENLSIAFFGAIVSVIFWYEATRIWRSKPF
jgi:hypothetical protein